ncbi:MAG: T9SS type A sorting domain-containing protein, partial [Bacteroidota bacterium]
NAKLTIADAGNTSSVTRKNKVNVYPNPASYIINIEYLMEQDGTFSAELMNLTGVVVESMSVADSKAGLNKAAINVKDLPNGA